MIDALLQRIRRLAEQGLPHRRTNELQDIHDACFSSQGLGGEIFEHAEADAVAGGFQSTFQFGDRVDAVLVVLNYF